MYLTKESEQSIDTLIASLKCVRCSCGDVEHVVALEGVCVVLIPFCDACWQEMGGEAGYDAILDNAIRFREQIRRN